MTFVWIYPVSLPVALTGRLRRYHEPFSLDLSISMRFELQLVVVLSVVVAGGVVACDEVHGQAVNQRIVVDDFEGYPVGVPPYRWKRPHKRSRSLLDLPRVLERDNDYFEIVQDNGNKRARAYTKDESVQIVRLNGDGYEWDLRTHPRLAWSWRAEALPAGAREDDGDTNDTGAAIYITFDSKDWLGRPRSIKYTYSSTLPVGTTADYGPLRLIVVASGADGIGDWLRIDRNVADDYRRLFGREVPERPGYIMLWNDSDNMDGVADVYFDDIELLTATADAGNRR
jgi:hypothetical protein